MRKTKIIFCISALTILMSSCSRKWLDVNENPNTPTSAKADLVFTNAARVTAGTLAPNQLAEFWTGHWGHSTSFTAGATEKTYNFTNNDYNFWVTLYDNIQDYQFTITNAARDGVGYLEGPAMVMQAMLYQQLVDLYGNVPYTDALKGTGVIQPKYDDAQAIYTDLIVKLDAAIVKIKAATFPGSVPQDIVNKGTKSKWVRFANTLKLRILIRQALVSGRDAYIQAQITNIINEGSGFLGVGEDIVANPGYLKTQGKLNPFYVAYGYDENDAEVGGARFIKISKFMIDWLKLNNDTFRLKQIAAAPAQTGSTANFNASTYVGVPLGGNGTAYLTAVTSSVGPGQLIKGTATKDMILVSAAESFFLRAEAAQRWPALAGIGSAAAHYTSGVNESFRMLGVASASTRAATLLSSGLNNSDFAASSNKLNAIYMQKWIALCNYNGLEAWSEFRRTGFPNIPISLQAQFPTQPVRLFYPIKEEQTNPANVPQGVNVFSGRIFWDTF